MSSTTGLEAQGPPKGKLELDSTKHQLNVNLDNLSSSDSDDPEEENEEPAVEELAIDKLAIKGLAAEQLAAAKLAAGELVAEKLAAAEPTAAKPTAAKPAAAKPAAAKPAAEKPAAEKLAAGGPVVQEPKDKSIPNGKEIGKRLKDLIKNDRKGLQKMYGKTEAELDESLKEQIEKGEEMAGKLITEMGCDPEVAKDLTVLTLYDVAILIDDSDSMINEEGGARKKTLIQFIDHITQIYSMANKTGILALRFLNDSGGKKNWTGKSRKYLDRHSYCGLTRIGTELKKKILDIYAIRNANQKKPLLVLIVTDGAIEGEKKGYLKKVIRDCVNEREGAGKGFDAVSFQFSRIGNDTGATQLLIDLDDDSDLGEFIDVLPVEFDLKSQLEDKWFVLPKILLGAILPDWDGQDYRERNEEKDHIGDRKKEKGSGDAGPGDGWQADEGDEDDEDDEDSDTSA